MFEQVDLCFIPTALNSAKVPENNQIFSWKERKKRTVLQCTFVHTEAEGQQRPWRQQNQHTVTSAKPFDLILHLFWTENMSVKCLSGVCTSAKTHSLHNLQSMRTKVQVPFFIYLFFIFFRVWLTKSLLGSDFPELPTLAHTHTLGSLITLHILRKKEIKLKLKKKQL